MIFAFLLLLQLTRYNVEGKHFLVETKDGGDQVGVDYGRIPGNSVSIGTSPLLQALLKCKFIARKPQVNSGYDIYTNEEVAAGVRHLKEFFGVPHQTCVMSQQRKILAMAQMTFNQCTWKTSRNEFSDDECPNVGAVHKSLQNCKDICLETPSCTAFNYNKITTSCVMRGCSLAGGLPVVPRANDNNYDGFWLPTGGCAKKGAECLVNGVWGNCDQVGNDYGTVPENSVDIPLLQYLLKCGHLKRKPAVNSGYDIYTNEEVAAGVRHLQEFFGLPQTGVIRDQGPEQRKMLALKLANPSGDGCVNLSESKVTFPDSGKSDCKKVWKCFKTKKHYEHANECRWVCEKKDNGQPNLEVNEKAECLVNGVWGNCH